MERDLIDIALVIFNNSSHINNFQFLIFLVIENKNIQCLRLDKQ